MFTCPLCEKSLSTQHNLQSHILAHTKEKPHKCLTCSAAFTSTSSLNAHVKTVHNGVKRKTLECHVCGHKCNSGGNLRQHLLKHSTDLPISCSVLNCDFKTKSKRGLQGHVRRVHLHETPYECTLVGCTYKTSEVGNLYRHLKVHSNERPFACQVPGCNHTCKTQPNLTAHTNSVHSDEKPWKCSICDFQTKHRSHLNRHQLKHRSLKPFECQVPNCRFASNSNMRLMMHFDRKHRKKQLPCTVPRCNYRCGSRALLKIHLKDHKLPILKCPVGSCNFSTKFKKGLLIHTSRNHGDEQCVSLLASRKPDCVNVGPSIEVVETQHCPIPGCGYLTDFPHRYDRHMMSHDKQKPRKFVCKFCPARFTLSSSLRDHIRRHLGEKPYSCSHCDYTAFDGDNLRCHARRVHRIFVVPRGDEHQYERKCRTCSMNSSSYSEFMLHSMTHLRPVVVLQRLGLREV